MATKKNLKINITSNEIIVDAVMPLKKGEKYVAKLQPQLTNVKIVTEEVDA